MNGFYELSTESMSDECHFKPTVYREDIEEEL